MAWAAGLPDDFYYPPGTKPDAPVSFCETKYALSRTTPRVSYGSRVDFDEIMGGERLLKNGAVRLYKNSVPQEGFELKNESKNYDYEVTWRYLLGGKGNWQTMKVYVYKGTNCHLLFTKETATTQIDTKSTFARTVSGRR